VDDPVAPHEQRLRRHAGVEGALAADQVRLQDRDLQSLLTEPPGAHLPRGPRTEDDHVEFALAHAKHGTLREWRLQTLS
jgi:hypothetical protein